MGNKPLHSEPRPPLPPKPHSYQSNTYSKTKQPTHCFTSRSEQLYDVVVNNKFLCDSKPIGTVISEFGSHLPLCLSVSESMYGICEDRSLMEGQLLSVHFQKEMKVLTVKAKQLGMEYTLPLSSSLVASVLYCPGNKLDTARRGYMFNKVSDLMNANPMPKIVCVHDAFEDLENNSVKKDDVIFIQNVSENENSSYLQCTNVNTGQSIKIGESCSAKFTTSPPKIGMPLSKILEFMAMPFDVTFDSPSDKSITLPQSAINSVYTVLNERTEQSVIVSTKYISDSEDSCSIDTIEIFLSLSLDVQLVDLPATESQKLRQETWTLYNNFQPSDVSKVICDLDSSINYVQTALYKAIRKDNWQNSISLTRPKQPEVNESDGEDDYESMDDLYGMHEPSSPAITPSPASFDSSTFPRSTKKKIFSSEQSPPQSRLHDGSTKSQTISPYLIAHRQGEVVSHERPYDYVKFSKARNLQATTLQNQQEEKKVQLYDSLDAVAVTDNETKKNIASENKQKLSQYTCSQVLELLEKLNLGKYNDIFKQEQIDGAIFVELDDEVLENELKIATKLHRLKLLRVLDGRMSLDSL